MKKPTKGQLGTAKWIAHKEYTIRFVRELKNRSLPLPIVLILLCVASINNNFSLAQSSSYASGTAPDETSCYAVAPQTDIIIKMVFTLSYIFVYTLSTIIMAYLGDAVIGYYNAVKVCLWLSWLGTLLQVISYCVQYGTCGLPVNIAKYGISGVSSVLIYASVGGFMTNVLPFGIAQLPDASSTQIRSFIHWLVWAVFLGIFLDIFDYSDASVYRPSLVLSNSILSFFLSCLTVCLCHFYSHSFRSVKPSKRNPYRVVYEVMRYAWRHKAAANRSAFTYWEDRTPSRIDLAKKRYGGPFVDQEPEDVKTFWRILAVLLSYIGLFIPISIILYSDKYLSSYQDELNGYGIIFILKTSRLPALIVVPLMELVILPLFPKLDYFLLSPMKGLFGNYILLVLGLLGMITLDVAGRLMTPYHIPCLLLLQETQEVDLPVYYFMIAFVIFGLNLSLTYWFTLEFICSQAPSSLHGILSGALWISQTLYQALGVLLTLPFALLVDGPGICSCSTWIFILNLVITIIGVLWYAFAYRYYRRRQRGEGYNLYEAVEKYYDISTNKNVKECSLEVHSCTSN